MPSQPLSPIGWYVVTAGKESPQAVPWGPAKTKAQVHFRYTQTTAPALGSKLARGLKLV